MSAEQPERKVRTRGHVVADLGVNFVERQILLAGFTMERKLHDYGLDTHMTTYAETGEVENETVWFQVKATDHLPLAADGESITFRVSSADLRYWLLELMPVVLVVYDAVADRAFWLDVQQYAEQQRYWAEQGAAWPEEGHAWGQAPEEARSWGQSHEEPQAWGQGEAQGQGDAQGPEDAQVRERDADEPHPDQRPSGAPVRPSPQPEQE